MTPPTSNPYGTLTIYVGGEVDLGTTVAGQALGLQIIGSATFTAGQNPATQDYSLDLKLDGQVNLQPLGNALDIAGDLTLDFGNANTAPYLYGALLAEPGEMFSQLQNFGLSVSGYALLSLNTDSVDHAVTLTVPGQSSPVTIPVAHQSISVEVTGAADFKQGGTDWFSIDGTFYMFLGAGVVGPGAQRLRQRRPRRRALDRPAPAIQYGRLPPRSARRASPPS